MNTKNISNTKKNSMNILHGDIGNQITLQVIESLKDGFMINSVGGNLFEGLAMYDFLINTDVDVGTVGINASAATLPLIASKTRWGTPNSRYLIHNPSNKEWGTSSDMQKMADSLSKEELRIIDIYEKHLSIDRDAIISLMKEERIIHPAEALSINLITEIKNINEEPQKVEGDSVMSIFNNFKMMYNMDKKENKDVQNELSGIRKVLDTIHKMLFVAPEMLVIQDVNGTEIDFGEDAETVEQIAVGDTATINGEKASGDYVLQTGETYKFEDGSLIEIVPVNSEVEAEATDEVIVQEVELLKSENETIKNELKTSNEINEKLSKDLAAIKNQFEEVSEKFKTFQNKFSDEKAKDNMLDDGKRTKEKFSYKRKK